MGVYQSCQSIDISLHQTYSIRLKGVLIIVFLGWFIVHPIWSSWNLRVVLEALSSHHIAPMETGLSFTL